MDTKGIDGLLRHRIELAGKIMQIALAKKVNPNEAQKVFMAAYEQHKTNFGSLKGLPQEELEKRMFERYLFMYDAAMKYIRANIDIRAGGSNKIVQARVLLVEDHPIERQKHERELEKSVIRPEIHIFPDPIRAAFNSRLSGGYDVSILNGHLVDFDIDGVRLAQSLLVPRNDGFASIFLLTSDHKLKAEAKGLGMNAYLKSDIAHTYQDLKSYLVSIQKHSA